MPITIKFDDETEPITGLEALKYLKSTENLTPDAVNFRPDYAIK